MRTSFFYRYKNIVLFYLLGFIVFSGVSSLISLKIFNMPFSTPEILFIPFLFLLNKKWKSVKVLMYDIVFALLVCFILLLIGLLYGQFSFSSLLSSSRSWLYLIIFLLAFSRKNLITNTDILWISIGSLSAWMIESIYNYQNLMRLILEQNFITTYGLMLAIPISFSSLMYRKQYVLIVIVLSIVSATIVFAGIRRVMAIVAISIVIAIYSSIRKGQINFSKFTLFSIITIMAFVVVVPQASNYMESASYGMYHRIFGKTEKFIETGELNSSDIGRQRDILSLVDNFMDYTIPRGMVSVNTSKDKGTGDFNDYPLLQLFWMFSWPVAIILVGWLVHLLYLNYRKYIKLKDETSMVSVNSIFIMLILLFLEGTYIKYPYATPITGMLLGRAILNAKKTKVLE